MGGTMTRREMGREGEEEQAGREEKEYQGIDGM